MTDYISAAEASKITGLSQSHLYRLAINGLIPGSKKVLSACLIPASWAEEFKKQNYTTVAEYAAAKGWSTQYVYKLIKNGKIKTTKVRNRLKVIQE